MMNWYKENIALQEELQREYPAVAEMIDQLEQQLSRYASAVEVEGRISFAGAEKIIRIGNVNDHKDLVYLQRVKVLVMKEVE